MRRAIMLRKCSRMLQQLDPANEAIVVGIEPPEIYTLKHDYVDLLPAREQEIQQRAGNVWLLDEFLLRSDEFNALRVDNKGGHPMEKERKT